MGLGLQGTGAELHGLHDDVTVLHRSHDAALRGYLGSLGADAGEVDELVQRTWVKTCRSIASFAGRSTVRTWLHAIARNEFLNYRTTRSRRERWVLPMSGDGRTVPGRERADAFTGDDVRDAVLRLPPRRRDIVILRYWYGMTCDEVALQLGVTAGTIKSQTFKALRTLREELEPLETV